MTTKISYTLAVLLGLAMIFLGARFFFSPEAATADFGIHFNSNGDYSFQYIKGIRDIFSGVLLCALVLRKERMALGIMLLTATMIPVSDLFVVLSKSYTGIAQAISHIIASIICFASGVTLLATKTQKKLYENAGYVKLISSADTNKESVMEMNILPGEKTPWHYHTLFSETFEILKGTLEVGKGKNIHQLKQGDMVTIQPKEKHYFHNVSHKECIIKVSLIPGNKNFENSLLIYKGLAKDGLASAAGTPKGFTYLALFVYLNNSRMTGIQKIAEPLFNYIAKSAIKKGRLKELETKYCRE
ncbi:MAG: hypothetical protein DI535_08005 [Citrobacter freundii]|nr:MAG: hypothetical protein DI535_08005 [Citrobacter freundii]